MRRAILKEIEEIVKEEATKAAQQVETRVRERCGGIAARILEHFSMQRFGHELRISVDFNNTNQTP